MVGDEPEGHPIKDTVEMLQSLEGVPQPMGVGEGGLCLYTSWRGPGLDWVHF